MNREEIEHALERIMECMFNLPRPIKEKTLLEKQNKSQTVLGVFPRDFGMDAWDWPQGVGVYGLMNLYRNTGNQKALEYCERWFDKQLKKGLPVRNINTTCPLLTMVDLIQYHPEYNEICSEWAEWIICKLPRTKEGGFQHTTTKDADKGLLNIHRNQIWIDTLFMTVLFLAKWGTVTGNRMYQDEAALQYMIMLKYLYDKHTGLFYHGWSFDENKNFSDTFWCRGNSWYMASVLDFIEILGDYLNYAIKEMLLAAYRAQAKQLQRLQSASGLWHTVLDDPDSYEETSGSAGIAYGVLKGIHMGVISERYMDVARRTIEGILERIDKNGVVIGVSAGTPVGRNREHYKRIITAPMAYGQSLCIMALSEALR